MAAIAVLFAIVFVATAHGSAKRQGTQHRSVAPHKAQRRARVPATFWGVVDLGIQGPGDFASMAAHRITNYRTVIPWSGVESVPGQFDWTKPDITMSFAAANRVKVLPALLGTPPWAANGCATQDCAQRPPVGGAALAAWASFVAAAQQRYGPKGTFWASNPTLPRDPIRSWQIYNEPNHRNQARTGRLVSPKRFAPAVAKAARVLHRADRGSRVILPGMFVNDSAAKHPKPYTLYQFLRGLYKALPKRAFDAVAIQPYWPTPPGVGAQIAKTRKLMDSRGDSKKPIIVSEVGWGSDPTATNRYAVTPAKQASLLRRTFKQFVANRRKWRLASVYWFGWRDPNPATPGQCTFCYSSGLENFDGTAKPALRAYKAVAKSTSRR